ncbi:response regulator transcription factor [Streptomyces sp. NBC_00455]|uniref:response regulator transcription factor n=1 Tax=Streptomyces sp. NBC_00455 TaxID=2903654 RepID=UPI003FCD8732
MRPLLCGMERHASLLRRCVAAPAVRAGTDEYRLTARQTTVLVLLAEALPAEAIGRRLGISVRTVHKHVENIYRKLHTRDRLETVLVAQDSGLLPTPGEGTEFPRAPHASGAVGVSTADGPDQGKYSVWRPSRPMMPLPGNRSRPVGSSRRGSTATGRSRPAPTATRSRSG